MKKIFFSLFFIISAIELSAKSVNFFTTSKPVFLIRQAISFNILESEEDTFLGFSTKFSADMKELFASTGLQTVNKDTDFTFQTIYWPTFFDCLNAGPEFKYHVQKRKNVFTEHDILASFNFKIKIKDFFTVFSQIGYHKKITQIDVIKESAPYLICDSISVGIGLFFFFAKKIEFYFSSKTNSYFCYPIFCSPVYECGILVNLMQQFSFGVEFSSKWIDMFTVSSSPTTFTASSFIQVSI